MLKTEASSVVLYTQVMSKELGSSWGRLEADREGGSGGHTLDKVCVSMYALITLVMVR